MDATNLAPTSENLFGRSEQLTQLGFALDDLAAGRGGLILFEGEKGIGKSSLAAAMAELCQARALYFAMGTCKEAHPAVPFQPFEDALAPLLDGEELRRGVKQALVGLECPGFQHGGVIRELFETPSPPVEGDLLDGLTHRQRIHRYRAQQYMLARVLASLAAMAPLALVLDDLDRADEGVMDFLEYFLVDLRHLPVLIVCTKTILPEGSSSGRGEAEVDRLDDLLQRALRYEVRLVRLHLSPLDVRYQRAIVSRVYPENRFDEPFFQVLNARSKGNPLAVKETMDLLARRGALSLTDDGFWVNEDIAQYPLPDRLADLILSRLIELNEEEFELLEFFSVAGRRLPLSVLTAKETASYLGLGTRALLKKMERFVTALSFYHHAGDAFLSRFPDSLQAIYDEIPAYVRECDHRLLAEVFPARKGDARSTVVRADHALLAREYEGCYELLLQSADFLEDAGSVSGALAYLRRAGECLKQGRSAEHSLADSVEVARRSGELCLVAGEFEAAVALFDQALPLCNILNLDRLEAELTLFKAYCHRMLTQWLAAQECYGDAQSAAEEHNAKDLYFLAQMGLAQVFSDQDLPEKALQYASGAMMDLPLDLDAGAGVQILMGDLHRRRQEYDAAGKCLAQLEDPKSLSGVLAVDLRNAQARLARDEEKVDLAMSLVSEASAQATRYGYLAGMADAAEIIGALLAPTDPATAARHYAECFFMRRRIHHRPALLRLCRKAAALHKAQGEDGSSLFYLEEAVGQMSADVHPKSRSELCEELGKVNLKLSKLYEAQHYFEETIKLAGQLKDEYMAARSRYRLGKVFAAQRKKEKAKDLLTMAREAFVRLEKEDRVKAVDEVLESLDAPPAPKEGDSPKDAGADAPEADEKTEDKKGE